MPATASEEKKRNMLININAHPPSKHGITDRPMKNRMSENPAKRRHCIILSLLLFFICPVMKNGRRGYLCVEQDLE
jgi:hypothetical protein